MTDQLYRIRPLEWVKKHGQWHAYFVLGGGIEIHERADGLFGWNATHGGRGIEQTFEGAKAAAEAHYRGRLAEALDPVELVPLTVSGDGTVTSWEIHITDEQVGIR